MESANSEIMSYDEYSVLRRKGLSHDKIVDEHGLNRKSATGWAGAYSRFKK